MTTVLARTGARLHFGLILGTPADGWEFGGVGLMLRQPGWQLRVALQHPSDNSHTSANLPDHITGASAGTTDRIGRLLRRLRNLQPIPPLRVEVTAEIPPHTGLGSGTQLALATTAAVGWLVTGELPPAAEQLAAASGRSERSAIGTAGFDCGGFLVDRGRAANQPRVQHLALPDHWRFLLVRPMDTQGLSGPAEQQWFQGRREMPSELTARLAAAIEQQLVPAIATADAPAFAAALDTYGDAAGAFYAPAQGGTFSHPATRSLAAELRRLGIRGIAQSSWGPGICIPTASDEAAQQLLALIPASIDGCELETTLAEPLNSGASITREAPPQPQTAFA